MGDTESQMDISSNQARIPVAGLDCIQLSVCQGCSMEIPEEIQAVSKSKVSSQQNGSRDSLPKTPSTQLIEY